jgi:hypothetical protein
MNLNIFYKRQSIACYPFELEHYEIPLIIVQGPLHVIEKPTGKFKREGDYRGG